MKKLLFYSTVGLFSMHILAQNTEPAPFPKNKYADIFNTVFLKTPVLYGIFDSTDSWFAMYQDTAAQSPFDSACLRANGKSWHRAQMIECRSYFTVGDVTPFAIELDSEDLDKKPKWFDLQKQLKEKNMEVWKCEGEFFTNEDQTAEYCGRYMGTFQIYFVYDHKTGSVKSCDADLLPEDEFVAVWQGFWRPVKHRELPSIAFFWANCEPKASDEGGWKLADLRMQPDGSQSNTNIAILEKGCMVPPPNWWK